MTSYPSQQRRISMTRVGAVGRSRVRRVIRTRVLPAALALTLAPWMLVEGTTLAGRLASLAMFTLVGLTVIGAGAIAEDLDSGEYAIAITHDTSPLEMLAGQASASLALTGVLVALQLPIALWGTSPGSNIVPLLLCIAWLAALLAGWLALMLLLATFLEGRANAVAMIVVLFLPGVLDGAMLARLPRVPAVIIASVVRSLPQPSYAAMMFRTLLYRSPAPTVAPLVLLASPFIYFALASVRLRRLEPAGRLTQ